MTAVGELKPRGPLKVNVDHDISARGIEIRQVMPHDAERIVSDTIPARLPFSGAMVLFQVDRYNQVHARGPRFICGYRTCETTIN